MTGWIIAGGISLVYIFHTWKWTRKKKNLEAVQSELLGEHLKFVGQSIQLLNSYHEGIRGFIQASENILKELMPAPRSIPGKGLNPSGDEWVRVWLWEKDPTKKSEIFRKNFLLTRPGSRKKIVISNFPEISSRDQPAAIRVCAEAGEPDATPFLTGLLKSEDESIRFISAEVLGKLKHRPAVPLLINLLSDVDAFSRAGLVDALVNIGGNEVKEYFRKQLESGTHLERREAENAMALLGPI